FRPLHHSVEIVVLLVRRRAGGRAAQPRAPRRHRQLLANGGGIGSWLTQYESTDQGDKQEAFHRTSFQGVKEGLQADLRSFRSVSRTVAASDLPSLEVDTSA